MRLILQPQGSSLCGQTCVAMVAGVSLERAIKAVGHSAAQGTHTRDVVRGLTALGIPCADALRRVSRTKPVLPRRAIVAIHGPHPLPRKRRWHWMLMWDGKMYDPSGAWPDGYRHWRITSYLEIREGE